MTFKDFLRKAKKADPKNLAMGIACGVGAIGCLVWLIASFL